MISRIILGKWYLNIGRSWARIMGHAWLLASTCACVTRFDNAVSIYVTAKYRLSLFGTKRSIHQYFSFPVYPIYRTCLCNLLFYFSINQTRVCVIIYCSWDLCVVVFSNGTLWHLRLVLQYITLQTLLRKLIIHSREWASFLNNSSSWSSKSAFLANEMRILKSSF